MGNSLLAVRGINHKYIVVVKEKGGKNYGTQRKYSENNEGTGSVREG